MYTFNDKNQKIALIGCGYWGTVIAKTLINLKFKNIFIHDSNLKNSKTLKSKFNTLKIENKYNNLIKNKFIKNFFFATPPSKNFKIAKKALINNKNIFIEKPGVTRLSDLKKLNLIAKKNNNKLMFGYVYCFNDYIKYIKKILNNKKLGKILYINFQRQNLGPIRNDVNVAFDLTSHDLSIILNLFKKLPKKISHVKYSILKKNIPDISNLHMKLDNIFFDINNSWINPTKIRRLTIVGSKKMLLFDEINLREPVKIYNKYAKYPKIEEFKKKFFTSKAFIYLGKNYSPKINMNSALDNEIKYFLNLKKKSTPITGFNFSYKILKFLKSI
tara:strand:- start:72 stop:1061 length:990 start_codon:yes stop_codon:yes gene_type:complete